MEASGIPYTILRPGRLTDGPYTSYDLNTLLKATAGPRRQGVEMRRGDSFGAETSRVLLAEACVAALDAPAAENGAFELISAAGEGPGSDLNKWAEVFAKAPVAPADS